jgi:hypothetical protein
VESLEALLGCLLGHEARLGVEPLARAQLGEREVALRLGEPAAGFSPGLPDEAPPLRARPR